MTQREYLQPLRDEMAAVEKEIDELERRLAERRAERTRLGRGLTALDPQWAASKPKKGWQGKGGTRISGERMEEVKTTLAKEFDGRVFNATEAARVTELHVTTIHKVLKTMHEQGQIQLDHLGGPRKTTRYFKLPVAE